MIEAHAGPIRGDMTIITGVGRRDMIVRFSGSNTTIVAGGASPGNSRMIEANAGPVCGDMTIITGVGGWNMIVGFAGGCATVMAG